jgi:NADH-quinone oxidoreductase subunit E
MARLTTDNVQRARELIALYPVPRSALIPILHVAQEQDGWLTPEAIVHVAELLDLTAAEVLGTVSFYDMFFTHPVGRHLVSVCTNIACLLNGGYELLDHAEQKLGVKAGATTEDGEFTLEEVECLALCGAAPCLTVNWRFFGPVTPESFDKLVGYLRDGELADQVPPHGTLCRVRRSVGLPASSSSSAGRVAPGKDEAAAPRAAPPAGADKGGRGEKEAAGAGAVTAATGEGAQVERPPGADTAATVDGSRHQKGGGA